MPSPLHVQRRGEAIIHLKSTLEDFKVKPELITEVMTIVGSVRDAVLNKKPETK